MFKLLSGFYGDKSGYSLIGEVEGDSKEKILAFFEGKYYDQEKASAFELKFRDISRLVAQESLVLDNIVNEYFDNYVINVDYFLDWFYNLERNNLYFEQIKLDSGLLMKEQLAKNLRLNADSDVPFETLAANLASLASQLGQLKIELAYCEVDPLPGLRPARDPSPASDGGWQLAASQSQADLARLSAAIWLARHGLGLALGPDSPMIEAISGQGSFIAAQNAIAYLPSSPDLRKLVSRPAFRDEILGHIALARDRAFSSIHGD